MFGGIPFENYYLTTDNIFKQNRSITTERRNWILERNITPDEKQSEETTREPHFAQKDEALELSDIEDEDYEPLSQDESSWFDCLTEHPNKFNQNYFSHLYDSLRFSVISGSSSAIFLIHALFPSFFEFTGGDLIMNLAFELEERRKFIQINLLNKRKMRQTLPKVKKD